MSFKISYLERVTYKSKKLIENNVSDGSHTPARIAERAIADEAKEITEALKHVFGSWITGLYTPEEIKERIDTYLLDKGFIHSEKQQS